jgi:hypothetical protein
VQHNRQLAYHGDHRALEAGPGAHPLASATQREVRVRCKPLSRTRTVG